MSVQLVKFCWISMWTSFTSSPDGCSQAYSGVLGWKPPLFVSVTRLSPRGKHGWLGPRSLHWQSCSVDMVAMLPVSTQESEAIVRGTCFSTIFNTTWGSAVPKPFVSAQGILVAPGSIGLGREVGGTGLGYPWLGKQRWQTPWVYSTEGCSAV